MTIMPAKVYKMSKEGREKKRKWVKLIQDYIHPTTIVLLIEEAHRALTVPVHRRTIIH